MGKCWGEGCYLAVRGTLHLSQPVHEKTPGSCVESHLQTRKSIREIGNVFVAGARTASASPFLSRRSITVSLYISRQDARIWGGGGGEASKWGLQLVWR